MKENWLTKLQIIRNRYLQLGELLEDVAIVQDQKKYRDTSKEYAKLSPVVKCFEKHQKATEMLQDNEPLLRDENIEIQALAQEEQILIKAELQTLEKELEVLLLPQDPDDTRNIFLEIRAAAGGSEAAIFAGDLFRMYTRYAETQNWSIEIISSHSGDLSGYKEIISRIAGNSVYSHLKFESGTHRVQRVPETEAQGRLHTSTCTVAVLPEVESVDEIMINPAELRIDTFRASGAGGQHVQKTDSAIRIVHLPTGLTVECQDERSQHKNRARALALLQARLLAAKRDEQQREEAETRRSLVGRGDRSERIRTYNFPQNRLTDHRINLTLYQLGTIMEGELGSVIEPLRRYDQAEQLASAK